MGRLSITAGKQVIIRFQSRLVDPCRDRFPGLLGDFKLYGLVGFLLHHNRSFGDTLTVRNITDTQFDQITTP